MILQNLHLTLVIQGTLKDEWLTLEQGMLHFPPTTSVIFAPQASHHLIALVHLKLPNPWFAAF